MPFFLFQAFKGKVKDYLQRRYLEQISEHQTRKDTFLKCRSDDLNCRSLKRQQMAGLVQSFEQITHDHQPHLSSTHGSPTTLGVHKTERTGKSSSFDSSSIHLQHSVSDTNLCCTISTSETNFVQSQSSNIIRSQSKRGLLQRCATIDMEDTPTLNANDEMMTSSPTSPIATDKLDGGKITFSIDRADDDDDDHEHEHHHHPHHHPHHPQSQTDDHEKLLDHQKDDHQLNKDIKSQLMQPISHRERKSRPFRHSHSDQPMTDPLLKTANNNFLTPYRHSFEHQIQPHDNRTLPVPTNVVPYPSPIPFPISPYSTTSDPGPYQSPWGHTPTNQYGLINFHFPKSQEHIAAAAQGSIAQLSTLTKFLCNESSVYTPVSPR